MTEFVLTNAQVRFGGRDITGILNQISLEANRALPESTVFGQTSVRRVSGVRDANITVNGWWDSGADLDVFTQHTGNASEVLSVVPENATEGSVAYSLQGEQATYNPGAAHGEVFPFSLELQSRNPLIQGRLLGSGTKSATGNSSPFQLGNVPAGSRVWAALHVTSQAGTSPTIDVILESDSDSAFSGSETTRITFAQVTTTLSAQILSAAGSITDVHWRLAWTLGGGSPVYDIFAVVGITAG